MGRLSRGCLRCRLRRVRCDEGRPVCQRCINRGEVCEGYRDEASIIFRYETDKVIEHARTSQGASAPSSQTSSTKKRSRSVDASSASNRSSSVPELTTDLSALAPEESTGLELCNLRPWLKEYPERLQPPVEDQAVDHFMEKYVMYPCNQTSSPGFLEHLPCMFQDVNFDGRYALRWAVRAAAYADISKEQDSDALANKALQCYGMALSALGESLGKTGKVPDDYDLMTVVVLDIFETLYTPDSVSKGSHAQGMAQILRLRGYDQMYNTRGWSLFRLALHRIQKQQLAYNIPPVAETTEWLNHLNDSEPYVRLARDAHEISEVCKRARSLLESVNAGGLPASTVVDMIKEMRSLDQTAVSWRQTSQWAFQTIGLADRPELEPVARGVTCKIQLHSDLWMAYEWNYHRCARIIFLQQLLKCCIAALEIPELDEVETEILRNIMGQCDSAIKWLSDEVLATVPQSLGDINHVGGLHDGRTGPPRCRGIGSYLLLWPIKIIKSQPFSSSIEQKERAQRVFERIRDYTGMKATLGDKSII
ncbi:hypothetical protein TWF694_003881 [Orbilia ellipsospora]|uniref:Zn(2)-C6 fungal-type domain-containing protein n=1 Tax=Orbilia ellipsospora TaxID=2528407 RepID=A0AAV9X0Q6_9PEZI